MNDKAEVARPLTLVGAPHPVTRSLFECVRAIVAAGGGDPESCRLQTSANATDGHVIHLTAAAIDAGLLVVASDTGSPPRLPLAYRLVSHLQSCWRDLPTITFETALHQETHVLMMLSEYAGVAVDPDTRAAARSGFQRLRSACLVFADPLVYLAGVDVDDAANELTFSCDVPHPIYAGAAGSIALGTGWCDPDHDGAWMIDPVATLRIMPAAGARCLCCVFNPPVAAPDFDVWVDDAAVGGTWLPAGDRGVLAIPLAHAPGDGPPLRTIRLSLGNLGLLREGGLKLRELTLSESDLRPAQAAKSVPSTGRGFADAGLGRRSVPQGESMAEDARRSDFRALVERTSPRRILIVSGDIPAALDECAMSDAAPVTLASIAAEQALPDLAAGGASLLVADLAISGALPELAGAEIDLIYFHHVQGDPLAAELLGWAIRQLSHRGILAGRENSAAAARLSVSALARPGAGNRLTFVLSGPNWRASSAHIDGA